MRAKQEARLDVLSRKLDTPIALLSKSMDRASSAGDLSPWLRRVAVLRNVVHVSYVTEEIRDFFC